MIVEARRNGHPSLTSSGCCWQVLCEGQSDETVYDEMARFVSIAAPMIDDLHSFLEQRGLNDPWKA